MGPVKVLSVIHVLGRSPEEPPLPPEEEEEEEALPCPCQFLFCCTADVCLAASSEHWSPDMGSPSSRGSSRGFLLSEGATPWLADSGLGPGLFCKAALGEHLL